MKKLFLGLLLGIMLIGGIAPVTDVEAAKRYGSYDISSRYCHYVEHNPGQVEIRFWRASPQTKGYYVKLTDKKGRYIWEGYTRNMSDEKRIYRLGRDHDKYRIYVRTDAGTGSVFFK